MRTNRTRPSLLLMILWLAAASAAVAQGSRATSPSGRAGDFCESNIANLDLAHSEAGDKGLIIAIARLGGGERNRGLNRRRLHNLKTYLEVFRKRAAETIVTAEGERVRGEGRLEIYIGGKLFIAMELRPGEDFHAGSCAGTSKSDPLFYDSRTRSGRGVYIPPGGAMSPKNKN